MLENYSLALANAQIDQFYKYIPLDCSEKKDELLKYYQESKAVYNFVGRHWRYSYDVYNKFKAIISFIIS